MHTKLRDIAGWAPLTAALSLVSYGVALQVWPRAAGRAFAELFQADPYWLQPLHGWAAVVPGVVLWLVACYVAAAAGWWLWPGHRAHLRQALYRVALRASAVLHRVHATERFPG